MFISYKCTADLFWALESQSLNYIFGHNIWKNVVSFGISRVGGYATGGEQDTYVYEIVQARCGSK